MQVGRFPEDAELARTALSCHPARDLLCQEMLAACSEDCQKVGNDVLK